MIAIPEEERKNLKAVIHKRRLNGDCDEQYGHKKDFEIFRNDAPGIVLFGSRARLEDAGRSDIDICIVLPVGGDVLTRIERKLGGKYDISVFENLPLYYTDRDHSRFPDAVW